MSRFESSLDEEDELSDTSELELPEDELETGFEEDELLDVPEDEVGLELEEEDEEELVFPLGLLEEELFFLSDEVDDVLLVSLTGSSSSSISFVSTSSTPCSILTLELNPPVLEEVAEVAPEDVFCDEESFSEEPVSAVLWSEVTTAELFSPSDPVLSFFLPQPQNNTATRQKIATKESIFFIWFLR